MASDGVRAHLVFVSEWVVGAWGRPDIGMRVWGVQQQGRPSSHSGQPSPFALKGEKVENGERKVPGRQVDEEDGLEYVSPPMRRRAVRTNTESGSTHPLLYRGRLDVS